MSAIGVAVRRLMQERDAALAEVASLRELVAELHYNATGEVFVDDPPGILIEEAGRFRRHSVMLNDACWRLAKALGMVPEGSERIEVEPEKVVAAAVAAIEAWVPTWWKP